MSFFELLEESYKELAEQMDVSDEMILEEYVDEFEGTVDELAEDLDIDVEDAMELLEQLKKRVDSKGNITRVKSKAIRTRRAGLTTGMSKAERQRRGRKAARTRKRNPGIVRKALKKRRKSLRRRKQMGIK